ncbi:MAG: hypothetical protein D6706_14955 [Chloroflexi bacterium]|nr:MAG: hypothetical protein D6706_14955 [Chloroflexota bacterium]
MDSDKIIEELGYKRQVDNRPPEPDEVVGDPIEPPELWGDDDAFEENENAGKEEVSQDSVKVKVYPAPGGDDGPGPPEDEGGDEGGVDLPESDGQGEADLSEIKERIDRLEEKLDDVAGMIATIPDDIMNKLMGESQ